MINHDNEYVNILQVSTLGQEADRLVQVSVEQAEPITVKHGEISNNWEKLLGKVSLET